MQKLTSASKVLDKEKNNSKIISQKNLVHRRRDLDSLGQYLKNDI